MSKFKAWLRKWLGVTREIEERKRHSIRIEKELRQVILGLRNEVERTHKALREEQRHSKSAIYRDMDARSDRRNRAMVDLKSRIERLERHASEQKARDALRMH